jgi:hypothetical protein
MFPRKPEKQMPNRFAALESSDDEDFCKKTIQKKSSITGVRL